MLFYCMCRWSHKHSCMNHHISIMAQKMWKIANNKCRTWEHHSNETNFYKKWPKLDQISISKCFGVCCFWLNLHAKWIVKLNTKMQKSNARILNVSFFTFKLKLNAHLWWIKFKKFRNVNSHNKFCFIVYIFQCKNCSIYCIHKLKRMLC